MPTRTTTLRSEAERLIAKLLRDPLLAQSVYYVSTGVWPIVHLRSFMALTGRKRDTWLVQTFGALAAVSRALDEAPARGWIVVDMAREWRQMYPP